MKIFREGTGRSDDKDKLTGPSGVLDRCYAMTPFIHSPQCFAVGSAENTL